MQIEASTIERQAAEYARLPYAITIEPGDAGGELCYVAYNPELPGCMAQGKTPQEAVESLQEARELYIQGLLEYKQRVPEPKFKLQAQAA